MTYRQGHRDWAAERRRATERTRVLKFFRELAKRRGVTCERCEAHPSSLSATGKGKATRWAEAVWNGRRENVYACAEHAKGVPSGYESATSWQEL